MIYGFHIIAEDAITLPAAFIAVIDAIVFLLPLSRHCFRRRRRRFSPLRRHFRLIDAAFAAIFADAATDFAAII